MCQQVYTPSTRRNWAAFQESDQPSRQEFWPPRQDAQPAGCPARGRRRAPWARSQALGTRQSWEVRRLSRSRAGAGAAFQVSTETVLPSPVPASERGWKGRTGASAGVSQTRGCSRVARGGNGGWRTGASGEGGGERGRGGQKDPGWELGVGVIPAAAAAPPAMATRGPDLCVSQFPRRGAAGRRSGSARPQLQEGSSATRVFVGR